MENGPFEDVKNQGYSIAMSVYQRVSLHYFLALGFPSEILLFTGCGGVAHSMGQQLEGTNHMQQADFPAVKMWHPSPKMQSSRYFMFASGLQVWLWNQQTHTNLPAGICLDDSWHMRSRWHRKLQISWMHLWSELDRFFPGHFLRIQRCQAMGFCIPYLVGSWRRILYAHGNVSIEMFHTLGNILVNFRDFSLLLIFSWMSTPKFDVPKYSHKTFSSLLPLKCGEKWEYKAGMEVFFQGQWIKIDPDHNRFVKPIVWIWHEHDCNDKNL